MKGKAKKMVGLLCFYVYKVVAEEKTCPFLPKVYKPRDLNKLIGYGVEWNQRLAYTIQEVQLFFTRAILFLVGNQPRP